MENQSLWPLKPDALLAEIEAQKLPYTLHHHPAFFTVEDGMAYKATIPGADCRNLFVRNDKKTKMVLVSLRNETRVDMKKLAAALDEKRFSFGSPELLWEKLGITPGSVCPFAILNNREHDVELVLEQDMLAEETVNFHPLINTMTIGMTPADLLKLLDSKGVRPNCLDMTGLAPDAAAVG